MNIYIEAEKKLAELLGWTNILIKDEGMFAGVYGSPPNPEEYGVSLGQRVSMPNWVMDNATVFALMVEHEVNPTYYDDEVMIDFRSLLLKEVVHVFYVDHSNKEAAVRYAIVLAVIAKIEGERNAEQ